MAKEHKHAKTYVCYDLNEVVDFSEKTYDESKAMVDEIFSRHVQLGSHIDCNFFREIFIREVERVHATYKEAIVFCLKGKMTFKQIQEVALSFF